MYPSRPVSGVGVVYYYDYYDYYDCFRPAFTLHIYVNSLSPPPPFPFPTLSLSLFRCILAILEVWVPRKGRRDGARTIELGASNVPVRILASLEIGFQIAVPPALGSQRSS